MLGWSKHKMALYTKDVCVHSSGVPYLVKLLSPVKFGKRKFDNWLFLICLPYMLISELIDTGHDCYLDIGSLVCSPTQIIHLYQPCFLSSQELSYSTSAVHLWRLQNFSSAPPPLFLCCRTSYSIISGSITLSCSSMYNVTLSKLGPVAEIDPVDIKWYTKYPSICIQLLFSELFATLCLHVYIFNVLNCYAIKKLRVLYARYFSQTSHLHLSTSLINLLIRR